MDYEQCFYERLHIFGAHLYAFMLDIYHRVEMKFPRISIYLYMIHSSQMVLVVKNPLVNGGDIRDVV